ncbi:PREDICTED: rop guanine nucleotide exchange factor 10 isoform X1 [Camelina sativa]|uniref:Rop guanine nucleotide exchange factor 10 isoform X1 n=2 Tax=Camelina sativa TaxID=90675 RepID=A0ABM1QU64_CAMSA|nr:PREDICTED: rop guanine nucleotide exchange factor 10 isoform X1 [Camelina sativa]
MVRTLGRKLSWPRSFSFRKMFDGRNSGHSSFSSRGDGMHTPERELAIHELDASPSTRRGKQNRRSDMEVMKERFAKLLLGEDMSGGGDGVTSALALSNAITRLADSMFGEQMKLQPMYPETKEIWRKEMDWLLSVIDHIVQFVPSKQMAKNGQFTEIMVTKQRDDLLTNIPALRKLDSVLLDTLDNFKDQKDFWYVPRDIEDADHNKDWRKPDENWWLPVVKVPSDGLSEESRRWLQNQKDSVAQVLKAATAINAQVLSEMHIPDNYIDSLPKNGKTSLGDFLYKSITEESFDPDYFISFLDLSTEYKVLDLKNRIEASMVIWKRKMCQKEKDGKSQWGSTVSLEKRELFEVRAETILVMLKQQFPGIPQSSLEISKIRNNKDVGQAILESYSRVLESLASKIMSRVEDVLEADRLVQRQLMGEAETRSESEAELEFEETEKVVGAETPNSRKLSDFIGWKLSSETKKHSSMSDIEFFHRVEEAKEKPMMKSPRALPKKFSYLAKLENMRSPSDRH